MPSAPFVLIARETGLLQAVLTLPFVLIAIPAGLMADRAERRWLMAGAEMVRAAALLGLGALLGGLYGVEVCLIAAVAGFVLQALVIARSPVVRLQRQSAPA